MSREKPKVWVINTHSTGELRCREGIAAKIDPDFEIQYVQGKSPEEIEAYYKEKFGTKKLKHHAQWPDFIISSGVRSTQAARTIKKLSGGKTFIIQNLDPKDHHEDFDLISIPSNALKGELKELRNHIATVGVPHAVTDAKLDEARTIWKDRFSQLPEPRIGVLIGGHTKGFEFTPELARKMAKELNEKVKELGGSLIVTTSRRTDSAIAKAFMDEITAPSYIHDWNKTGIDNPYMGILACSDAIVVTGDSMSMCSEATTSRKPVYIYAFDGVRAGLRNLHKQLYKIENAKPFEALIQDGIQPWEYTPPDTAGFIASEAMKRWRSHAPRQQAELVVDNAARRVIEEGCLKVADNVLEATSDGVKSIKKALHDDKKFKTNFLRAVHAIRGLEQGRILITGVGKSLRVGELAGASLGSLSIPCEILDPTHAVHGDLGKMQPHAGDILIAISKSGNSEELRPVVEEAKRRGLSVIAITHQENSFLGNTAKEFGNKGILLKLPEIDEPHPFINAEGTKISPPTVSTTQVKALFEAIGLAVAKAKGMEVAHFQTNHPAGALGKRNQDAAAR